MWNEFSIEIGSSVSTSESQSQQPIPAVVKIVEAGSIGEEIGLEAGDKLLSINGVNPRDLIDYRYLIADEELHLEILDAEGKIHEIDLEKDPDESLGLVFTEALFNGLRQCNNQCPYLLMSKHFIFSCFFHI